MMMKKTLLAFAALAATLGASAFSLAPKHPQSVSPMSTDVFEVGPQANIQAAPRALNAPSRGSGSMDFTLAGEPYTALSFNGTSAGMKVFEAFLMNGANATKFADNQITAINFWTGCNQDQTGFPMLNGKVFLSYDLEGEPFYIQDFAIPNQAFTQVNVPLDTPYDIVADQEVYVGVQMEIGSEPCYYIVVDYTPTTNDDGGYCGVIQGSDVTVNNIASQYGSVCVGCTITGDALPENEASPIASQMPLSVEKGNPFSFLFLVQNNASNDIENVEVTYTVGDQEPVAVTVPFEEAVAYHQQAVGQVDGVICQTIGNNIPVAYRITKINGNDNANATLEGQGLIASLEAGTGYLRNVMIEEGTGTWCGWCPAGATNLDWVGETYTDGSFIPVAIHSSNGDPMETATYKSFINNYISGFPSSMLNRTYECDPRDRDGLVDYYNEFRSYPAIASVEATARFADDTHKKIVFDAATTFAFDAENVSTKNYRLCFVATQDSVGPYVQQNYYSGMQGDYYGWEDKPATVNMTFDHVARMLSTYAGIAKSVPEAIVAGERNEFSYTMSLPTAAQNSSKNPKATDQISVIVFLLNKVTGVIENSCLIPKGGIEGQTSGIAEVAVDAELNENAPVEYFNLQGVRVANPAEGQLLIRRQGSKVEKVIL